MHNSMAHVLVLTLMAALSCSAPIRARAADKPVAKSNAPAADEVEKEKKTGQLPFHGKLNAVDKAAKTITLEGKERKRVILISSQTRIAKAGKPATLDEAVLGDEVAGQLIKVADGKEEAVSLRLGPKPEPQPKEKKTKKEKATP